MPERESKPPTATAAKGGQSLAEIEAEFRQAVTRGELTEEASALALSVVRDRPRSFELTAAGRVTAKELLQALQQRGGRGTIRGSEVFKIVTTTLRTMPESTTERPPQTTTREELPGVAYVEGAAPMVRAGGGGGGDEPPWMNNAAKVAQRFKRIVKHIADALREAALLVIVFGWLEKEHDALTVFIVAVLLFVLGIVAGEIAESIETPRDET